MTAFTLPNNGIFVENAPQISNVTVSPNYFDPATGNFQSPAKPAARVELTLSETADVTLQVVPVGGASALRTITRYNAPSGQSTIDWDGKADNGILAAKGEYRLALKAIDPGGSQSIVRYLLMRVFY
jgi:hypothetical protein